MLASGQIRVLVRPVTRLSFTQGPRDAIVDRTAIKADTRWKDFRCVRVDVDRLIQRSSGGPSKYMVQVA